MMERSLIYTIAVFIVSLCNIALVSSAHYVLSSPRITNFGDWGPWDRCPKGSYVYGMRLKTEPVQGPVDDTSLNGVQFLCGVPDDDGRLEEVKRVQSIYGHWGTWGTLLECRGYAIGFQLRSEAHQGDGDDTAANNVRLICSKGFLEGGGLSWGEWTTMQLCPRGQVICSLRTQVQSAQGSHGDDTSLNNIDAECCHPYSSAQ